MVTHLLGFPRMGRGRELKAALEAYWAGGIDAAALGERTAALRLSHWTLAREAGIDLVPVGDFSLYDHMLDMACLLGAVPERFGHAGGEASLDTFFAMARGVQDGTRDVAAMEMTKWFDTNYHYIVPEFTPGQRLAVVGSKIFDEARQAAQAGFAAKAVLPGPFTFLMLGKSVSPGFDRFSLLPDLLEAYRDILGRLGALCPWIELDEPILAQDPPEALAGPFKEAYGDLARAAGPAKVMLATYFGGIAHNLSWVEGLPLGALHIDCVRDPTQIALVAKALSPETALSLGLVDGRNIWRVDAAAALARIELAADHVGAKRLMLAPSCSLLHCPVDLEAESALDPTIRSWMAFAVQKCREVRLLADAAAPGGPERSEVAAALAANRAAWESRRESGVATDAAVRHRVEAITVDMFHRPAPYKERAGLQAAALSLPPVPTTTIGSFPQTPEIRQARRRAKTGEMDAAAYETFLKETIADVVARQEALGLDVLVHGEPERNDMVEYFGERLAGFCFTKNGWVQSYGARCVKPPVIYGDVSRPGPMTVDWSTYAASLTKKPMKGMLTGPATILCWSFVRDDQPRETTRRQIALAMRDEVADLERAGLRVIQIDEPALREGLPLRRKDWEMALALAVDDFRLTAAVAKPETQIHTHMCYAEFNDIVPSIAAMDADVISIEASRSRMELLTAFADFQYPNEIGPGLYDIHSPRVPSVEEMEALLKRAAEVIPPERLWANPDCGLKTRAWPEVSAALANMVEAARRVRAVLLKR
ncbi:5-methyltetrahydropteroyltriglutamate/homocysteine S-methyltransferase [Solidesulfovibrio fructosivorans JJ]]|uniref:5-methyltetrahydropteroyltriglutamate--homocysteine methyltransferase n=1 Tax=Solidesulfovibrio fructosivorans JJ] TaxID=596151 RepID=E1JX05_SOLFR|nr:5-methyltetrahydropteroyltriglutamate--homocysteine S-methyltransferase [Solidesulfovibrio fructosivorans]EFL51209.1 5-methyltetrahydropteroyltriglutamate/homocysteine S-methyltransferase [Solidesulfovibrio fructosivorans JJ]]